MRTTDRREEPTVTRNTDPFFGFLAGLYAAALVAPAVTVGLVLGVTTDPAALFFALLGTVVAVTAGVGWVARKESVAVALGRTRWVWLAPVVGFGFGATLLFGSAGGFGSAAAGVSLLGMFVGAFVGLGLAAAAQNRHTKAVLADVEEHARFRAPAPERDRRVTKWAAATLGAAGVVGVATPLFTDYESGLWLFQLFIPIAAGIVGATAERTFAITDAGLLVGTPVHKRIRPWSAFESYSLTDDALVLRRAGWSARGLRDVRRDPDDIEELAAVERALAEFLPRR